MSYPFQTFPLTKRIGIVNPVANLDARYGPWPTFNDALTGFSSAVRERGLTVAVSGIGGIVEYWYRNGVADNDLVLKTVEETAFKSLSGKLDNASTVFMANSANYILDGGNTKSANITIGTNDNFNLNFETGGSTRATLTSGGNLGIGITTPTDRLEVNGTLKITGNLPSIRTTTNRFSVNETNTTPPNETGMVSQFASGPYGRSAFAITHTGTNTAFFGLNSQLFSIGGEGNTDIRFVKNLLYGATDILNSGSEMMRIKASNNSVGIGTIDPNQILTVVGNISATQLLYASNLIPGTLFLPNYILPPTNLDTTRHGVFVHTVSSDLTYTFQYPNFQLGNTTVLYLSGNHESIKRHTIIVAPPGPPGSAAPVLISGAGQSNRVYTFQNHVTKLTLTCLKPTDPTGVVVGVAEIIRTDLNANQGGLGFVTLETETGPTDFLAQENGDRLVLRNFV